MSKDTPEMFNRATVSSEKDKTGATATDDGDRRPTDAGKPPGRCPARIELDFG
jgi:hypothetical protein